MGRCIVNDRIANIKFLRRVVRRDSDGFEKVLATNDRVGALRGDIERGNWNTGLVGNRLGLTGTKGAIDF